MESRLYAGQATLEEIRRWLTNRYYFEETMMRKDCIVLERSDDHAFRKVWVKRVTESQAPGGGLDQWLEMCESAGVPDVHDVSPAAKQACDEYLEWCRTTPWKTVVAASLSQIRAALNHTEKTLHWPSFYPTINWGYFVVRKDQAREDSQRCLEFIEKWNLPESEKDLALKLKRQLMVDVTDM